MDINANIKTVAQSDAEPMVCVSRIINLDESKRQITHVISSAKMDRGNRIVDVGGWQLANFRKNPVVLANHSYDIGSIIGRSTKVGPDGDALVATTEFDTVGMGAVAFRLAQAGLARAWSVGWKGSDVHRLGAVEDCPVCSKFAGKDAYGAHYTKQDLLEYSLVAVPANPEAVMGLQAAGLELTDQERETWLSMGQKKTESAPANVGAPNGAKADEVVAVAADSAVPKRSSDFYDALFGAARTSNRHYEALRSTRRLQEKDSR